MGGDKGILHGGRENSRLFFFFFWYYFLWVSAGWYIFKLFYQSTLMTHRNNFLCNLREGDAVSLLGYSAVGYLFVPDCREVISCCGWFIPCVNSSHWIAISSQDHIGLGSVVSELSCWCLFHLSLGEKGKLHSRTWAASSGNWGFWLFLTTVWIQSSLCPDILSSLGGKYTHPEVYFTLVWVQSEGLSQLGMEGWLISDW